MDSQVNETNQTAQSNPTPWKQDFFKMFGFESSTPQPQAEAPSQGVFEKVWHMWKPTTYQYPHKVEVAPKKAPAAPADDLTSQIKAVMPKLVQAESRGRHRDKNGNLTTSPVGAKGITQVMADSGRDPGYGVKPLQNDTEEEYLRFGEDLLTAYTKEFGGDIRKGLAAYNAGPGRVKTLLTKHGEQGWEAKLPKETRDYLKKIMGN